MSRTPAKRLHPLLVALLAIGAQVPLFWAFAASTEGSGLVTPCVGERCNPPRARIQAMARPPVKPPDPPLPENVQVVETPEQPDIEVPKPVESNRVSDKTTRTPEETKAPTAEKTDRKRPNPTPPRERSPVQSETSKSAEPTVTDTKEEKIELADAKNRLPEADKGPKRPETIMDSKRQNQVLLPPGSNASAMANLQALASDFSTNDHLPDVKDGSSTILNADRHRFADFFLKVKSQVERHWKPSPVYSQRDPTGQVYGVKDRYTVLSIELDRAGVLTNVRTSRTSGLDFMDEEARRAFREASPFLNPPKGLVGADGFIRFEFGFYFEITAGRLRTNWRRL